MGFEIHRFPLETSELEHQLSVRIWNDPKTECPFWSNWLRTSARIAEGAWFESRVGIIFFSVLSSYQLAA